MNASVAISKRLMLVLVPLLLAACGFTDPYAEKFEKNIAFGDSRGHVLEVMKSAPSSVNRIETPFFSVEQLAWKTAGGRVYLIHTAMNRVIAKTTFE